MKEILKGLLHLKFGSKRTGVLIGELLKWADVVFVMDLEQEMFIDRKFHQYIDKVIVVGCDDRYPRESPQLIRLVEYWVKKNNL